jgi:tetratricopeptide (TPR) repeat protein
VLGRAASPFRAVFVSLPRFAYRWFRGAPRWLQAILLLVALGAVGGGGYYAFHTRMEVLKQRKVGDAWKQFEQALREGRDPEMRAALDAVLAADPADGRAARWKRAVESGEADPGDPPMIFYTLGANLRAGKLEEAVREADKRLAYAPHDWTARCVRAQAALARGDKAAVNEELDKLIAPDDSRSYASPVSLLRALHLFRAVGRDTASLRAVVQNHVVEQLRRPSAQRMPPGDKMILVEFYLEAFEPTPDKPQPPAVAQGWAPAAKLADLAADEAAETGDVAALARVGRTGPRLAAGLRMLRRHDQVTAEQFPELSRELEDRTRRVWQAVREKDPKNPEAYLGLAQSYLSGRDAESRKAAWQTLVDGLEATGRDPRLYAAVSRLLVQLGEAGLAWNELKQAAEQRPDEPVLWMLAADAAWAAGRPDLALHACEKVREKDRDNKWAALTEARVQLASGYPRRAVELFEKFGEPALAANPGAGRPFARALTEAGQEARVEKFLEQAEQAAEKANDADAAVAVLVGWSEARPVDPERARKIAGRAERLLSRWPDEPDLYRVRAAALFAAAEGTDPPWESVRVREAVQAAERLRAKFPDDPDAATWLGWLRLAEGNPERALREVAPLRAAEMAPRLTMSQKELLGAIYRRTGKLEDALRLLEPAARSQEATAGVFVQLALTYHDLGRPDDARAALEKARNRPRTPREHADYVAAYRAMQK